jgi:hypothetical protein
MGSDDFRAALQAALDTSTEAKIKDDAPARIRSFVEAVDDVPGVDASARSPHDDFARVSVANDYGTRDEFGTGNVTVAPGSKDPVGREAAAWGLVIARTSPHDDFVDYWFATVGDYVDGLRDGGSE